MVVVRNRRPRLIGRVVSHYRILEHLGGGGMGVVYKAEDAKLHRTVALKFLAAELTRNPAAKERFLHEARAASALDHPNICTIFEVDETLEGQLYLAMAFYDGETLEDRIFRGPLPPVEAIDIALQVARGLARAHESGIIHRDVKPANIIVTLRGEAKIVDFGLAKLAGQVGLTRTGASMGTPTYMSPEQADGKAVDFRTDLWSLGVLLYEMVTGRKPFSGDHPQAILHALLHSEPEPPSRLVPAVSQALERVIAGCLTKDPGRRYASAQELIAALTPLLESSQEVTLGPGVPPPAVSPTRPTRPARRPPVRAVVALLLLLCLLALGGAYFLRRGLVSASPGASPSGFDSRRIAVLPFENLGPPEDAYFASGITEEITSRLASIHGLAVISRTSALQYEKVRKSIREIGRELGVDYVLEGSVRWEHPPLGSRGPSHVRVTPQLIRVADDTHLWAERYDRTADEIFKVQSDIAERVTAQLNIHLLQPERQFLGSRPTANLEAYQAYLRGRVHLTGFATLYSQEAGIKASQAFERAVALDPGFAEAWAGLALTDASIFQGGFDPSHRFLDRAKLAVDRSLSLAPQLPDAHIAKGYYLYWSARSYDAAIRELTIAAAAPSKRGEVAEAMGYIRRRQGRFEESIAELEKAFALDPRNPNLALSMGEIEMLLRHYDRAERYLDTSIAVDPDQLIGYLQKSSNRLLWRGSVAEAREILAAAPPADDPYMALAAFSLDTFERSYDKALKQLQAIPLVSFSDADFVYPKALLMGELLRLRGEPQPARAAFEEARQILERKLLAQPGDARLHSALGIVFAGLGRRAEALREGRLGVRLNPIESDAIGGTQRRLELAQTYALLGDGKAASEQLAYLLSHPALLSVPWIQLDPAWDPIRNDPSFRKLLQAGS
ncbi:MAG TPA: protein kinase [Thermoanaerobaculia bacterium]|nr:protein kinase [Thermoanaerobaculia bacterium]